MSTSISLIADALSHETIACTRALYEQALRGELTGLAFAGTIKGNRYIVNTAGVAHDDPTLARGMVRALDDELGRKVWGQEPPRPNNHA